MMIKFKGKMLVLGAGAVSQCTLPLILKHIDMPAEKITVLDCLDLREKIKDALAQGVRCAQKKITPDNYSKLLSEHLDSGDILVDLAWNIDTCDLLQWCYDHNVRYINASVELWDPYTGIEKLPPTERTLYVRHIEIQKMQAKWKNKKGPSAVVEHGANPGLVSHFTKRALIEIAERIIEKKPKDQRIPSLKQCIKNQEFNRLAYLTGVKVIHISERDTQITNIPKEEDEFVNTWSVEGYREEGTAPAEMGWGTHERKLPPGASFHNFGPGNQICLARPGIKTWVRSWVPCGEMIGMVVRHGEAFTISDHLTVWEEGKPVYRPTVHYAYLPADAAVASLVELEMRQFSMQKKQRIITDEIVGGRDELGVLLMGHDFKSWWTGSLLDIHEARALVPHQNATTLQVACSVLAAIVWLIRHPNEGVCVPDDLPHEEILETAMPYLGPFVSRPVDWTPLKKRVHLFENFDGPLPKEDDVWQFSTFLVQ